MKTPSQLLRYSFVLLALLIASSSNAFDVGPTVWLERYTLTSDTTYEYDQGNLLSSGKFKVLYSTSGDISDLFGISSFDILPVSGRPIMEADLYASYKADKLLPHWDCSRDIFYLGTIPYVIVSIIGGQDPNPTITINTQPQGQAVPKGGLAIFSIDADPVVYISYQWCFNGKPIPGETSLALMLSNVQTSQAGEYSVLMSTGGRSVSSAKARLVVFLPVQITSEPTSQTVKAGHPATFHVAATGTGPFKYQWVFNGTPIPKATGSTFTIPKVNLGNAGNYTVHVESEWSAANSSVAVLTVAN